MATSPLPSSSAIPPSSPTINPPPPSSVPPPVASLPPKSQPNANSDPPTSSNPSPPSSPPPVSTAPPPSLPTSPPPASQPPLVSPPPPSANSPPPASSSPSLPTLSPPPPSADSPPPASSSPSLPTLSPPPPSASSPSLTLSPPPPSVIPPSISPPPPTLLSPPPPTPISPSPPVGSPPAVVPPPSPSISQSPPPPLAKPPVGSPPTPPSAKPPVSSSPPPPSAKPPESSPTPPVPPSSPPLGPQTPPSVPSAPPTKSRSPPVPSSTPPPPSNSSSGTTPSNPAPSPPTTISPPLPSPALPSGNPATPVNPSDAKKSNSSPNVNVGLGGSNSSGSSGIKTGTAVTIAVVAGFVILSLLGVAVWFVRKRKKHVGGYGGGFVMPSPLGSSQVSESSYPRSPSAPLVKHSSGSHGYMYSPSDPGLGNSKSWFTYGELSDITHGFSNQNLLGEGGFGCVYKGCLPDGREVAVKQLKVGGAQGEREFRAEVETISRVHHRHLVSLVGYCISDNQRLLVYDYVPNNTLYYHLHEEGRPVMDWATRVRVAAGAARGIAYLHEDCHPRVIHRDIKSSNILLDNNFEAQVSDFGLARLAMDACTHVTTRVMGTFGYLAPEYASTGKLTDKSDVYSFGVVLLELVTGRKPVDSCQPLGDESLVEWARPLLSHALENGEFDDLPDPRLEKNYNESEMFRMIEAAAACIRHSAAMRPRMGLVVRALDGLVESDLNNGVKPGQSELFNSAQQSAEIRLFQRMAFGSQEYSSDFSRTSWKSRREL